LLLDQVRINSFLQKKNKKNATDKTINTEAENVSEEIVAKETEKARKQVTVLMEKNKLRQVKALVRKHDSFKPWGQEAQVKVCLYFHPCQCTELYNSSYFPSLFFSRLCDLIILTLVLLGRRTFDSAADGKCIYTTSS